MESTPIAETPGTPSSKIRDAEYTGTPMLYISVSRKRKIMDAARKLKTMSIGEPEPSPIPYYESSALNSSTNSRNILTSTLNESTSEGRVCKRTRLESHASGSDVQHPFTPSKQYYPQKMDTPEKFKILYPHLKVVKSPAKPKTPQKLLESIQVASLSSKKRDPLEFFCVLSQHNEIVHKILGCMSGKELLTMQQVSHLWQELIDADKVAKKRYLEYIESMQIEKENRGSKRNSRMETPSKSPPPSPNSVNYARFKKAAERLDTHQELTKCFKCIHPAVKQGLICQCTNRNCGYIWCTVCMSSSTLGPKHFRDRCARSKLSMSPLSDLSNTDSTPSFLLPTPETNSATLDSSGYVSMNETESSGRGKALQPSNSTPRRLRSETLGVKPFSSVRSVMVQQQKREEREGSASPEPKLHSVGSAASRRNLRRLF